MAERIRPSKRVVSKKRKNVNRENIFSRHLTLWVFGGAFVVILAIVLVLVLTPSAPKTNPLDKSQGPADAKVVLTEYGDFQCPACKAFATDIEPKLKADFVEKGLVRFTFRQMAFIGDESILASEASECANDQGKFWEFYTKLYENQGGENTGVFTNASLEGFAKDLKLDTAKFSSCLTSHKYRSKVLAETNEGQTKGVYQTPSVLINDKLADWGGDYTKLQSLINDAIKNSK